MPTAATDPRLFTDDMGEVSGIALRNPGYEADCRRMIMAGADWLAAHPNAEIAITKAMPAGVAFTGNWEDVFEGDTPHGHELLQVLHRACCADRGDKRGPSALMMAGVIEHIRWIERHGWEAYVAECRRIAAAQRAR